MNNQQRNERRITVKSLLISIVVLLMLTLDQGEAASPNYINVNCTTSTTQVLAQSNTRRAIFIQNISDTAIWIKFGAAAVVNEGHAIPAWAGGTAVPGQLFLTIGGDRHLDLIPTGALNCIHDGTGNKVLSGYTLD